MFYQLWFTDLQILVAMLPQSSHHQPLPAVPPCHTTLAPFTWASAVVSSGCDGWGTDLVEINCKNKKNKTKQNKTKKKREENKILPILQAILFLVFNLQQFPMRLAAVTQGVIWAQLGEG